MVFSRIPQDGWSLLTCLKEIFRAGEAHFDTKKLCTVVRLFSLLILYTLLQLLPLPTQLIDNVDTVQHVEMILDKN